MRAKPIYQLRSPAHRTKINGTVDLLNALRHVNVAPNFGAAWYIPTFLVPLLLVTHFMIFVRLLKRGG